MNDLLWLIVGGVLGAIIGCFIPALISRFPVKKMDVSADPVSDSAIPVLLSDIVDADNDSAIPVLLSDIVDTDNDSAIPVLLSDIGDAGNDSAIPLLDNIVDPVKHIAIPVLEDVVDYTSDELSIPSKSDVIALESEPDAPIIPVLNDVYRSDVDQSFSVVLDELFSSNIEDSTANSASNMQVKSESLIGSSADSFTFETIVDIDRDPLEIDMA